MRIIQCVDSIAGMHAVRVRDARRNDLRYGACMYKIPYRTILIAFVLAATAYTWSHVSNTACVRRIGSEPVPFIMTAFRPETDAILELATSVTDACSYRGVRYVRASFGEREVVIFEGGVGPEIAARSARATLDAFSVEYLLFAGIAGAIDAHDLAVGDTVVAQMWTDMLLSDIVETDPDLLARVESIDSVEIVRQGVTSEAFVTDSSLVPLGTAIVDMESHAVARVANAAAVPFLAIRSVSDYVGTVGTIDMRHAAEASARAAYALLQSDAPSQ